MLTSIPTFTESQIDFLNPEACKFANPYSRTFWQDVQNWSMKISKRSSAYPKADEYRQELAPYLLHKVHLLAEKWTILDANDSTLWLLLRDIRLTNVYKPTVGVAPDIYVDHMNITVSKSWLNRVVPDPNEPLTISGVLYEYVSTKEKRNIVVLPVLIAPRSRRLGNRANITYTYEIGRPYEERYPDGTNKIPA